MKHPNKDFIAVSIADYEAMKAEEQGKLLVQVMEDQPILMGFITNIADEFADEAHEALVDCVLVLINAFVSAGIPVQLIPRQMVDEVLDERMEVYENNANAVDGTVDVAGLSDSPKVFEDLRNYALFRGNLKEAKYASREQFEVVLDTMIAIVERAAAAVINPEDGPNRQ